MTAEEIPLSVALAVAEYVSSLPVKLSSDNVLRLCKLITAYGLQKQNEVLDKAADIADRSYDFRTCEWQPCQEAILNLKNKL